MKSRVVSISEIRKNPNLSLSAKDFLMGEGLPTGKLETLIGVDLANGEDFTVSAKVPKKRDKSSSISIPITFNSVVPDQSGIELKVYQELAKQKMNKE